ncbi:PepSY domain-containing protein [Dyadobacter chenwenxiniae]|uniref:PepSY domain-containing protein n=1 Tax=Dyadobacter chenwenxiniae TaxID=2906456 RepID=A0A9X1PQX4_9BACT|nr:PepSY-associated TM helix domain-containing protein [Dyadobacter chenwenxiniae]MCF0065296.1 PepSY domain-containing protein [Dyadobacter chenwenxiniae]UON84436.1 PepSY domain-containing protein [Dyadobacter chenwenxiniae]
MKKNSLHRSLFKLHSWLGLFTGIFLILLGLSGSVLVFRTELDHFFNRDLLHVSSENPLPNDALKRCYDQITSRYPNLDGIAWVNPDDGPDEAYNFRMYFNDTRLMTYDLALISFNPYTGAILREGPATQFTPSFIEWLFQFHFSFQLGMPGAALTAIFGITMLFSLLSGAVVYRKMLWKVVTFKANINRKNWRTISSDLHRIIGVWSLVLNAVIFFTGFWMNLFAFKPKTWQNERVATKPNTHIAISPDEMYAKALAAMPDLEPTSVYLPTQPERRFEVRGYTKGQPKLWGIGNAVRMDQQTGDLIEISRLSEKPLGERVEATFFPLHVGNFGGLAVKMLYVLIGLTPGLLAITGFLLWWRGVKKPQTRLGDRANR